MAVTHIDYVCISINYICEIYRIVKPEMTHIAQEEKGDPTDQEFLFQHKLYAPA